MKTNESPFSPFEVAVKYLTFKPRSIKEVVDYLKKKDFKEEEIDKTVKRLLDLNFLNDQEYAKMFARSRQIKGKSRKFITYELNRKGVEKEDVESTIQTIKDDLKIALEYIEKRIHQFERLDTPTKKRRIISRLQSRGYNWDVISKVLREIGL